MPIRFYCPYCNQLLGISTRKRGAIVGCPSCGGKVGVPREGPAPPPVPYLVLTPPQLLALAIGLLVLAGLAFAAGLLVGALS